ncbi:MAG: hypothetical protein JXA90_03205 [Planctomycetes bacterium]|nr:hypothetical protein [Planctomycetota bacterium]
MSRCHHCGREDDLADELRRLITSARRRSSATAYGQACAAMVPFYERALAVIEEGSTEWSTRLRAMRAASPSAHLEYLQHLRASRE